MLAAFFIRGAFIDYSTSQNQAINSINNLAILSGTIIDIGSVKGGSSKAVLENSS